MVRLMARETTAVAEEESTRARKAIATDTCASTSKAYCAKAMLTTRRDGSPSKGARRHGSSLSTSRCASARKRMSGAESLPAIA
jgi:hypothetical protein